MKLVAGKAFPEHAQPAILHICLEAHWSIHDRTFGMLIAFEVIVFINESNNLTDDYKLNKINTQYFTILSQSYVAFIVSGWAECL